MPVWERLRRRSRRGERPAAEWVAAGSPLPPEERRVEGLAFELGQVLFVQGWRRPRTWAERQELIERVVTGPRWRGQGYRWAASADEGWITDPAGTRLITVSHEPRTNGHTIERYDRGRLVERTCFDESGRVRR